MLAYNLLSPVTEGRGILLAPAPNFSNFNFGTTALVTVTNDSYFDCPSVVIYTKMKGRDQLVLDSAFRMVMLVLKDFPR